MDNELLNLEDTTLLTITLTKICSKCKKELNIELFNFRNKKLNKRHTVCSICQRQYKKDSYHRNYESNKLKFQERRTKFKTERLKFLDSFKKKCYLCDETFNRCLEFHHLNKDEKLFNISTMKELSLNLIIDELKKCIVLCANCHRKVHYKQITLSNITPIQFKSLGRTKIKYMNNNKRYACFTLDKLKADLVLYEVEKFINSVEECNKTNEQWFLDFEDKLNKLSIKDHDRNKHIED